MKTIRMEEMNWPDIKTAIESGFKTVQSTKAARVLAEQLDLFDQSNFPDAGTALILERGDEAAFVAAPDAASGEPGEPGGEQHEERSGQAEQPPDLGAQQEIEAREQRGLVKPDVAIEELTAQHLDGGGEREIFFRPEDADVAEARQEQEQEQQRKERARFHLQACSSRSLASMRSSVTRKPEP